jgi:hypothetical protein
VRFARHAQIGRYESRSSECAGLPAYKPATTQLNAGCHIDDNSRLQLKFRRKHDKRSIKSFDAHGIGIRSLTNNQCCSEPLLCRQNISDKHTLPMGNLVGFPLLLYESLMTGSRFCAVA